MSLNDVHLPLGTVLLVEHSNKNLFGHFLFVLEMAQHCIKYEKLRLGENNILILQREITSAAVQGVEQNFTAWDFFFGSEP